MAGLKDNIMQSLIDKLGNYEVAKEIYNDEDSFLYMNFTLQRDLLSYRRKHNIFETGDYFCYADKYLSDDPDDGEAYVNVHRLDLIDFACGWIQAVLEKGSVIRHATDDEIKTKRRM